ncbi:MAG: DUF2490 domain-containing protein [Ferruginibacter sp.]
MNRLLIVCILLFAHSFSVCAQATKADPTDAEGWYSVGVAVDLPKKWTLSADYQARFLNNLSTYYGSYLSVGAEKQVNRHLNLITEYRAAFLNDALSHRLTLGASTEWQVHKKTSLSLRVLAQNRIKDFYDTAEITQSSLFWRVRLGARYKITKKWSVQASIEPIMEAGGNSFVDNWRNTLELGYRINKKTKLELYYIYRPDYGKAKYNRLYHIVGTNVVFYLDADKKNKSTKKRLPATTK